MFVILYMVIPVIIAGYIGGLADNGVVGLVFAGGYYVILMMISGSVAKEEASKSDAYSIEYKQEPELYLKRLDNIIRRHLTGFVQREENLVTTINKLKSGRLSLPEVRDYVEKKTPEILVNMMTSDVNVESFVFADFLSHTEKDGRIIDRINFSKINDFYSKVNEYVLSSIQDRLDDIDFKEYSFVEVCENSFGLDNGGYIYKINEKNDLVMLHMDLKTQILIYKKDREDIEKTAVLSVVNPHMELNPITIPHDDVKDFQLFGNEQVVLDFSNMGSIHRGSMTNEFLFGSGTSVVRGMQKALSNITHKTLDLRTVQLVNNNKQDIIFGLTVPVSTCF